MLYPPNLKSQHFVFVENDAAMHHPFTMPRAKSVAPYITHIMRFK